MTIPWVVVKVVWPDDYVAEITTVGAVVQLVDVAFLPSATLLLLPAAYTR